MLRSVLTILVLLLLSAPASAITFGFGCITNNDAGDCAIGEAQLELEVVQMGDAALFTIRNLGPAASVVEAVYWSDPSGEILGTIWQVTETEAVSYDIGLWIQHPALIGGEQISWQLGIVAENPHLDQGAGPGEEVVIKIDIRDGSSFEALIAALTSREIQVGVNLNGYESDGNESFVLVPEPAVGLLLLGAGVAFVRRTRRV